MPATLNIGQIQTFVPVSIVLFCPDIQSNTCIWYSIYQTLKGELILSDSPSHSRGTTAMNGAGLGIDRPAELTKSDDEYDAYRKRMMLAYRFRPNPLVTCFI